MSINGDAGLSGRRRGSEIVLPGSTVIRAVAKSTSDDWFSTDGGERRALQWALTGPAFSV